MLILSQGGKDSGHKQAVGSREKKRIRKNMLHHHGEYPEELTYVWGYVCILKMAMQKDETISREQS